MSARLIVQFSGWCLIRLPTDPDPPDEPRGVSGYTFAFADEPDLDRILHLQVPDGLVPRSHGCPIGVTVVSASRLAPSGATDVPALHGARVELLDEPRFENRNWTVTLPGFEPIVPFHLHIERDGIVLDRTAPLDPANPDRPVWEIDDEKLLAAHGARGMEYEPETIGRATGIWDSWQVANERCAKLQTCLGELGSSGDDPRVAVLNARIAELEIGIRKPKDRRIMARYFVQRFGFPMLGAAGVDDERGELCGRLDENKPWLINFWLGAWDPDLLSAYMEGSLEIPYLATA